MPTTRRRSLLLPPLLALATAAWPSAAADGDPRPRVGEVQAVTGEAHARFGTEAARVLVPEAALLLGDLLSTGPGARLACRLEGGIALRLGANANLRIDALTLRGPRPGVTLRGSGGPLLFDRPSGAPAAPVSMVLPWARIGVRGTRFFAGPSDGVLGVFCARGAVLVETPEGLRATLNEGEGVDVPPPGGGGPPQPRTLAVRRWGAARIARALASVE
jgi:ferric-dicitrate binding protein FerR (iron transport regulator)